MSALGYGLLALIPTIAAAVLLFVAETWRGRVFAVAGLGVLALPPLAVRAYVGARRQRRVLGGASAVVGSLVLGLYLASPDGRPLPGSPVRSEFLEGPGYRRFAVAALLPEIDQINLGTYLVPAIDPLVDLARGRRIREVSLRHYRPMEADPAFAALGTVMPDAFADRDAAHLFAYAPPHAPGERLPAILFLHGSGGNFKAYFYLWRRYADETRSIVVCPSFGFGNWYEPGGVEAVERARAWAVGTMGADERRIVLVGLSNGGTGVTRAAAATPGAYQGLVFLSAVVEDEILRAAPAPAAPAASAGATPAGTLPWPMLFIHGNDDERIPVGYVVRSMARLRQQGASVDEWLIDGQDHFLFFDRDAEVLGRVRDWVSHL